MAQEEARMSEKNVNPGENENLEPEFDKSDGKGDSTLFSTPETAVKKGGSAGLKKQKLFLSVIALLVLLAMPAYYFVIKPMTSADDTPEPPTLMEGEGLTENHSLLMYTPLTRDDVSSIRVENSHGEYGIYYDAEDNMFFYEHNKLAECDNGIVSSLINGAITPLVIERVAEDLSNADLFGLSEGKYQAKYTLSTFGGISHTVYIGDEAPDGKSYYCRYEGRNAVYLVSANRQAVYLKAANDIIVPNLLPSMEVGEYLSVKDFAVIDGEKVKVMITYLNSEESKAEGIESAGGSFKMLKPANYAVDSTTYTHVLEQINGLKGISTLSFDPDGETIKSYGFDSPSYAVMYEYGGIEWSVFISEKNENGRYYVYSPVFKIIGEVSADKLSFLDYKITEWVDKPVFIMNINDIKTITVESDTATRIFDIDGSGKDITVTERITGFMPDVYNFRQFYKTVISVYLQDSAGYTFEEIKELEGYDGLYLTLNIETDSGVVYEYKFYPYTTRRAFYTVNGEGEMYVLRDMVTKVISDAEKVMTNTAVNAEEHS